MDGNEHIDTIFSGSQNDNALGDECKLDNIRGNLLPLYWQEGAAKSISPRQ